MKTFLIILAVLVAGYLAVSAVSFYLLKLNKVTSPATVNSSPITSPGVESPVMIIQIVDGPAYVVEEKQYDMATLRELLIRRKVRSVEVRVLIEKGFSSAAALMTELRRLEINVRIENPNHTPQTTTGSSAPDRV